MKKQIWFCKIGECDNELLPNGADFPMRMAVRQAYMELTGRECEFLFSGWGQELTDGERAVVQRQDNPTEQALARTQEMSE